jgi:hypothetical protein
MDGLVRFKRTHKRSAEDVFNNLIKPKIPLVLNDFCQKISTYNRRNHRYINRTGACENSNSWVPTVQQGARFIAYVIAGGDSKATRTWQKTTVFYRDDMGRLRVFPIGPGLQRQENVALSGHSRRAKPNKPGKEYQNVIRKGTPIYVDYAIYLERKGYPVIRQGIEYYRHKAVKALGEKLKLRLV